MLPGDAGRPAAISRTSQGLNPYVDGGDRPGLRFDVHPPNLGVGGFDGLFNGTDRVFDLFGGQ